MDITQLKTLRETDIAGKKILYRSPYDIGVKQVGDEYVLKSDGRIVETLPTLKYLLEKNCAIAAVSWLKRPNGKVVEELRMKPVAKRLSELLGQPVEALSDCVGPEVKTRIANLKGGEMVVLENTRFHPEEEAADLSFAKALADGFDMIVYDGFPQAHRIHASTTGIMEYLPAVAGFTFEKEIRELSKIIDDPAHPFVVVMGGAKISDKVGVLEAFLKKADCLLIGGAVANTFLKSQNIPIGKSLVEDVYVDKAKGEKRDYVELARQILEQGRDTLSLGDAQVERVQIPLDLVAAKDSKSTETIIVNVDKNELIPDDFCFFDIGPRTIDLYTRVLKGARLIFMNGPMGFFEEDQFAVGTESIGRGIIDSGATSVVAGGDTESIVKKYDWENKFTHASTSGGAALDFLGGNEFPVLKYLIK